MQYHQDHVFPQSLFRPKRMAEVGLSQAEQKQYLEMANSIANLQLLLATENVGKSDDTIDQRLPTRDARFRKRFLLPDNDDLLTSARFPLTSARFPLTSARFPLTSARFPLTSARFPLTSARFPEFIAARQELIRARRELIREGLKTLLTV